MVLETEVRHYLHIATVEQRRTNKGSYSVGKRSIVSQNNQAMARPARLLYRFKRRCQMMDHWLDAVLPAGRCGDQCGEFTRCRHKQSMELCRGCGAFKELTPAFLPKLFSAVMNATLSIEVLTTTHLLFDCCRTREVEGRGGVLPRQQAFCGSVDFSPFYRETAIPPVDSTL